MRFRTLAATAALTAASTVSFLTIPSAGAADPAQVRVTSAYTYAAGHNMDVTVCVDGTELTSLATTSTTGPFSIPAGTHTVKVLSGQHTPCTSEGESRDVTFSEGETSTLVALWDVETGEAIVSRGDDLTCTAPGTGRVVVRQMGAFWVDGQVAVDVRSGSITLGSGMSQGDQASNDLATGTIPTPVVYQIGTDTGMLTTPNLPVVEGTVIVRTIYGGIDGDAGSYDNVIKVGVCDAPTTTTPATTPTTAPATTVVKTEAAAATAVKATPTYTG